MAYPLGQQVMLTAKFSDQNGNAADPSNVTLFLQQPNTVVVNQYTWPGPVVHASAGVFTHTVLLSKPGTWTYSWEGTGAVQTGTFDIPLVVQPSAVRTT